MLYLTPPGIVATDCAYCHRDAWQVDYYPLFGSHILRPVHPGCADAAARDDETLDAIATAELVIRQHQRQLAKAGTV